MVNAVGFRFSIVIIVQFSIILNLCEEVNEFSRGARKSSTSTGLSLTNNRHCWDDEGAGKYFEYSGSSPEGLI